MKALVYRGPGQKAWTEVPKPTIQKPTDAIVRIQRTTICGTDLHILKGDVPEVEPGRILGHEGVGVIEAVGSGVERFRVGDRVLISCITSCGTCEACKKGMYSHCSDGGWILGHLIDGTQAEYVRIPYADNSLYPLPPGVDEAAWVMLSDILPTGFEVGVLNGKVQPGQTVAIVGAGPVGLAALLTAQFYSPAELIVVDLDDNRLEVAKAFGATAVVNSADGKAAEKVLALTHQRGVDVAIEAVGIPQTFAICQDIVAAGGRIANIGVHGKSVELHLERLWTHNITITTGLVDTNSTPLLIKTVKSGRLDPHKLITHTFRLDEVERAYDVFGHAGENKALKVLLES
ncbi:MAG: zinc-dependent alcohol dehydrogenase family protein [Firmicutes bacterium]|nr:zinc-dependent alcohol dehydrogenase family protein [Bacillota bacterium]